MINFKDQKYIVVALLVIISAVVSYLLVSQGKEFHEGENSIATLIVPQASSHRLPEPSQDEIESNKLSQLAWEKYSNKQPLTADERLLLIERSGSADDSIKIVRAAPDAEKAKLLELTLNRYLNSSEIDRRKVFELAEEFPDFAANEYLVNLGLAHIETELGLETFQAALARIGAGEHRKESIRAAAAKNPSGIPRLVQHLREAGYPEDIDAVQKSIAYLDVTAVEQIFAGSLWDSRTNR